jgi:hypothetical protein
VHGVCALTRRNPVSAAVLCCCVQGAHSVSGEVTVTQTVSCDTTSVAHSRVCTNGAELLKNQHGEPSLTTSVTLR